MIRSLALVLAPLALLALLGGPAVRAEEPAKEPQPLTLASDSEVEAALEQFKEDWKASGLSGTDKVMQREYAMRQISALQHPEIIKALGKAAKSSDGDLRLCAVIYLSDQKALPHLAAQYVLAAMKRDKKDVVMQITALQALGDLKYLGASHDLKVLLKHKHFAVRKSAITTIGQIGDMRLLSDVLEVLGVKLETEGKEPEKQSGGKEVVEEGYSWEGAEAVVDRGEADNTQENADAKKQAEAKIAANKAAAESGRKGGGGGGPGSIGIGGSGGRGGSSRSTEELIPAILRALKALTGEEFDKPSSIRKWVANNKQRIEDTCKALDEKEKAQKQSDGK